MNRFALRVLPALLIAAGVFLFVYKVVYLEFPLKPDAETSYWVVESHVSFRASNKPVKVGMFIPRTSDRFLIVDENFVSRGFGLSTQTTGGNRRALWSRRKSLGYQGLYYRAVVHKDPAATGLGAYSQPVVSDPGFDGLERESAEALVREVQETSSDSGTFVTRLLEKIGSQNGSGSENVKLLLGRKPTKEQRADVAARLLALAGFEARVVRGIYLSDSQRRVPFVPALEAKIGKEWTLYDISVAAPLTEEQFFVWWRGSEDLLEAEGVTREDVTVSVDRLEQDAVQGAVEAGSRLYPSLFRFSLFSLPVETQAVYRILLLIPLGALIVVLIRNVIGIKTTGTFMPVLVALAFRETELFWGITLYVTLVGLGLGVRFLFEHLRLLLVPRLAAVLTVVVILMVFLSIFTHQLDLERGVSVALFPMVIVTMSIERLAILWEELGGVEALKQGFSGLVCAIIIYCVISIPEVRHLFFVFPELLLCILGILILLGRYTGYRLVELRRFRALATTITSETSGR